MDQFLPSSPKQAVEVAELAGDREGAGRAVLSIIEELRRALSDQEKRELFERAQRLLSETQHRDL
jgi:hypothetical protein